MQRVMLKSKIHRATVSDCDLHYVGSITIDPELLEAADIREHEHSYAQYDEAELSTYEPRVVHVAAGTNQIIDVDSEVATLLA